MQGHPASAEFGGNAHTDRPVFEGACTLVPELATFVSPAPECKVTLNPGNGWFDAPVAWIWLHEPTKVTVRLFYEPGRPEHKATLKCGTDPEVPFQVTPWWGEYVILHQKEIALIYSTFTAGDWDPLRFDSGPSQNGEFVAKKSYERSLPLGGGTTLIEETWFFLKHTPDKPEPQCSSGGT
jgi:hypothetical protein